MFTEKSLEWKVPDVFLAAGIVIIGVRF